MPNSDVIRPEPRNPLWWFEDTACQDEDRDLFLRAQGKAAVHAKRICEQCPSKDVCLVYGMSLERQGLRYGIYGGMTATERDQLGFWPELAGAMYVEERALLWETINSPRVQELRAMTS